jgi:hypothetical protein
VSVDPISNVSSLQDITAIAQNAIAVINLSFMCKCKCIIIP